MKIGSGQLDLILFSVAGVPFGTDAEQIAEIGKFHGEGDEPHWFHEELGFDAPTYLSPTVLTVRTGAEASCRVVIDSMTEIASCSLDDIHPFPAQLEPFVLRKGMWGVLLRQGVMVYLVDFLLMLKPRMPGVT